VGGGGVVVVEVGEMVASSKGEREKVDGSFLVVELYAP